MPYYCWQGVTLEGRYIKGGLAALNDHDLYNQLISREIALIGFYPKKWFFQKKLNSSDLYYLTHNCARLITSGMPLPQALVIVAQGFQCNQKKTLIFEIINLLNQGHSFSKALSTTQSHISPLVIALLNAGQESGTLFTTLNTIAVFCQMKNLFQSKLRSTLLMPAITFLFFVCITLFIIMIIIPQFALIYQVTQIEVTGTLYYFILLNKFFSSWIIFPFLLVMSTIIFFMYRFFWRGPARTVIDFIYSYMPIIGNFKRVQFQSYFFYGLGSQLSTGISTLNAFNTLIQDAPSGLYKRICINVQQLIHQGNSLSVALERYNRFFDYQAIGLIKLGQETGKLGEICNQLGAGYQEDLIVILNRLPLIIQPLIIFIVGLLVGILVLAIYGPIVNLGSSF